MEERLWPPLFLIRVYLSPLTIFLSGCRSGIYIYLRKRAAEVYLMKLHALAHNCSDSWYTRVAGAGNERNMRKGNDNEAYLAGHRQRGEPTLACASAPARLACSAARISMSDRCQCHCLRRRGTARGKGEVEGRAEGA